MLGGKSSSYRRDFHGILRVIALETMHFNYLLNEVTLDLKQEIQNQIQMRCYLIGFRRRCENVTVKTPLNRVPCTIIVQFF
jgi:hypothetical protein